MCGAILLGMIAILVGGLPTAVTAEATTGGPNQVNYSTVNISNILPRRDSTTGEILPFGEGNLVLHEGVYYLYGVVYQPCPVSEQPHCYMPCGAYNMTFGVATSTNLMDWTLISTNIMPDMANKSSPLNSTAHTYFEPAVMYNEKTKKFVMWFMFNFKSRAIATSDSPTGPFSITVMPKDNGLPPNLQEGSGTYVWKDQQPDKVTGLKDGYLKFNIIIRDKQTGPNQFVGRMADDYLSIVDIWPVEWNCVPAAHSNPIGSNSYCFQEGGGMLKSPIPFGKNESTGELQYAWYVLGGNGCCFCSTGSDVKVWRSLTGVQGPYDHIGYLNPPLPNQEPGPYTRYTIPAQMFGAHQVLAWNATSNSSYVQPLYIGMRWGSALDGKKNNDFQYWAPIEFNPDGLTLKEMQWEDQVQLKLAKSGSL